VRVSYGEGNIAETEFSFTPEPTPEDAGLEISANAVRGSKTIYVTGSTDRRNEGITLTVTSPNGYIVSIDQVIPNYNGEFTSVFTITSPLWDQDGDYTITAHQNDNPAYNASLGIYIQDAVVGGNSTPTSTNISFTNPRTVDAFGNRLDAVSVDQQVQITADIINHNNFSEDFTYYITIRETGFEAWITGSLSAGQSFSPALSWIPIESGIFTVDISLFDNIGNKNKLAESLTLQIIVVGTSTPPTFPSPAPSGTDVVILRDSGVPGCELTDECWFPSVLTVDVGETVTWYNADIAAHTVTSVTDGGLDGVFDSSLLMAGESFSHRFDKLGTFDYFCMVHPWMVGTVIVGQVSSPTNDTTPPKILQPTDITVDSESGNGIRVSYDVLVIDETDQLVRPSCSPSSGSVFEIGETRVICNARDSAGNRATLVSFYVTVNPPKVAIPDWIKNVALFWCEDKIDDASFIEGIQYLIDNNIIIVSASSGSGSSQDIPNWVKNNACWWSEGLITAEDFASGIEFLVKAGIIRV